LKARERETAEERCKLELIADYWTAAFFYPVQGDAKLIPTHNGLVQLVSQAPRMDLMQLENQVSPQTRAQMDVLKSRYKFFHWWLEFPEIFFDVEGSGKLRDDGGFDVVVGNPPWERVKLQAQEFFSFLPQIADAANADAREKAILDLKVSRPKLWIEYQDALENATLTSVFLHFSGRFPLTAVGDVNTYSVFAEHSYNSINSFGRSSVIIQTSIVTDGDLKFFFQKIVDNLSLVSLIDFDNRELIFPGVHRTHPKFCILTLAAPNKGPNKIEFSFFNANAKHLYNPMRRYELQKSDFALLNPVTFTCPVFRSYNDAEITKKIYKNSITLNSVNSYDGSDNEWEIRVARTFDLGSSILSRKTIGRIEFDKIENGATKYSPILESKMIHQYNHRYSTYEDCSQKEILTGEPHELEIEQLSDPAKLTISRNFIEREAFYLREAGKAALESKWLLSYRDVTNSSNERTCIASIIPFTGSDYTLRVAFLASKSAISACFLVSTINSLCFDYAARQKLVGLHLSDYIFSQLPLLPKAKFVQSFSQRETIDLIVIPKVLELVYTAWDLAAFANDVIDDASPELTNAINQQFADNGGHPLEPPDWLDITPQLAPFRWDDDRRAKLRAELDAIYAHLYKLTRDELRWVLDPRDMDPETPSVTFSRFRLNEEKAFGEYRTKRLVLEYFDVWAERLQTIEEIFETTVRA
jgi:hypothetical protein